MQKLKFLIIVIFVFSMLGLSLGPKITSPQSVDTAANVPAPQGQSMQKKDTQNTQIQNQNQIQNQLPIDTAQTIPQQQTVVPVDTVTKFDSTLITPVSEETITNTKLFIYILLTVLGLALFFYIFVINLFKTFHRRKSTRQSLLLSWSLFFIVTIIWIFIIWGLVAGFWAYASFMIIVIFLFIISLIMTIIAVKSK